MIRSLYRSHQGYLEDIRPEEFVSALQDEGGLLWVDFVDEPTDECELVLHNTFGFHPLAIDDALEETHVPKIDDWGEYLYLVLHAVVFDRQKAPYVDTIELDIFLGKNYVVTFHNQPIQAIDHLWMACRRDERYLKKEPGRLLYQLADELVASYMPVVEELDDAIELIEDQIFTEPAPATLAQLFALKRALLHLRRIVTPQREVLNKLARGDYAVIDTNDRVFFRDVYDHLVRLHDINESMRDLVSSALETYLSVVNNRMNEVMKTLTIITTLFMPVSFVVGFFGMNFFQAVAPLPMWTGKMMFGLTLGALIGVPLAMFLWIRRRAWM